MSTLLKNLGAMFSKQEKKYDIKKKGAMKLLEETDIVVLDVRTPDEIAQVPAIDEDAVLINLYDNFKEQVDKLDKTADYLVICAGGIRSRKACEIMETLDFTGNLYSLVGGMKEFNDDCG